MDFSVLTVNPQVNGFCLFALLLQYSKLSTFSSQ